MQIKIAKNNNWSQNLSAAATTAAAHRFQKIGDGEGSKMSVSLCDRRKALASGLTASHGYI
jgi:hypothetical protein